MAETIADSVPVRLEDEYAVRLLEDFAEPGPQSDPESSPSEDADPADRSGYSDLGDDEFDTADNGHNHMIDTVSSPFPGAASPEADIPGTAEESSGDDAAERSAKDASTSARGGDKGLAAAFSEILAHPGPANLKHRAPILLASKSLAKRHREEEEAAAVQNAAKKLRQEMRKEGHVAVPRKGENPAVDAHEKMLYKIANRGVVQLFNAVSKAQRTQKEALASGVKEKDARVSKTRFLDELRGKGLQKTAKPAIGPQEPKREGKLFDANPKAREPQKGWDVLDESYAGLQGAAGLKMKDWDKQNDIAEVSGQEESSSEDNELEDW